MSKKPKEPEQNLDGMPKKLVPPKHLKKAGLAFWHAVTTEYTLKQTHVSILTAACECLDRAEAARLQLDRDGLTTDTEHGGLKTHPCVGVEKSAKFTFVRLIRELGVKEEAGHAARY